MPFILQLQFLPLTNFVIGVAYSYSGSEEQSEISGAFVRRRQMAAVQNSLQYTLHREILELPEGDIWLRNVSKDQARSVFHFGVVRVYDTTHNFVFNTFLNMLLFFFSGQKT